MFEIEHLDGEQARELRIEHARAVSEVLQWLIRESTTAPSRPAPSSTQGRARPQSLSRQRAR
jgi:hypothetical protein